MYFVAVRCVKFGRWPVGQEGLLFWSNVMHLHTCHGKCACVAKTVVLKRNVTCQTMRFTFD